MAPRRAEHLTSDVWQLIRCTFQGERPDGLAVVQSTGFVESFADTETGGAGGAYLNSGM